ncbi:MAG: hypothetical protein M5R40_18500 [Anaerolineae bacterium]|nr:hypothetical protein [Anaerolineae bacterium]
MSDTYKIIVTGPFNSGKTQFIKTISDIDVVSTERRITTEDRGIKAETTVAMDYGRVKLGDKTIHMNGTPGAGALRLHVGNPRRRDERLRRSG